MLFRSVPGKPARARIAPVGDSLAARAWSAFTVANEHDPGAARLTATTGESAVQPLLRPSVISIADATAGWSATIDGRAAEISRTDSGTVLIDVPLGARSSVSVNRTDRSRVLWLVLQGLAIAAVCVTAFPGRRREDEELGAS